MSAQSKTQTLVNALGSRGLTRARVWDYASLLSGQVGRLVFSVVYFITLARTLSLGDFGLFATASAIGVVLSRVSGFGFISPLYRISTMRPRLIGAYTMGYVVAVVTSLPLVFLISGAIYFALYTELLPFQTFALIVFAEVLLWRTLEMVIIVLNGRNRFAVGSGLAIAGVATKAAAALWFSLSGSTDLANWAFAYFAANGLMTLIAVAFFYPRQRLRWTPKAWIGRSRDALGVSAAEVLFYVQSELDKVLVLAFGGEAIAGIYAILMRLVDLTAMPLRALNTMLIQWIMRLRQSKKSARFGIAMDAGIAAMSVAGLLGIVVLLWIAGDVVGENIMLGSSYLLMVLLVPAFRNIIEYHTELLYAHERMAPRVWLLGYLTVSKAALLIVLLGATADFATIAIWLNAVFAVLYVVSALVTYVRVLNAEPAKVPDGETAQTEIK